MGTARAPLTLRAASWNMRREPDSISTVSRLSPGLPEGLRFDPCYSSTGCSSSLSSSSGVPECHPRYIHLAS
eukprot:4504977-Amphidinium_carterae.1